MTDTKQRECGDWPLLTSGEFKEFIKQRPLWTEFEENGVQKIKRKFVCKNFQCAMDFIVGAGEVAEKKGHHPDLHLTSYRNVEIIIYSHSQQGITELDFILAKEIDEGVEAQYSPKWARDNGLLPQKDAKEAKE